MALYQKAYTYCKDKTEPTYKPREVFNALTVAEVTAENPTEMTLRKVGNILEVDKETSKQALKAYNEIMPLMTKNRQEWYQQNRKKIFGAIEDLAAESLLQKIRNGEMSGKDLTSALKTLHQLGRLESGLSTENIAQSIQVTNKTSKPLETIDILPEAIKPKD